MRPLVLFLFVLAAGAAASGAHAYRSGKRTFTPTGKAEQCFGHVCNATAAYPDRYIAKLMAKKRVYEPMFGAVIRPAEADFEPVLRSAFGGGVQEENICETRKVTVFPKIAYDIDLVPRYIINVKNHIQSVSFETCVGKQCFGGQFLFNYSTACKQLYNFVRLLYISHEGKLGYGTFSVPSTCVCIYKKSINTN